MPLPTQTLIDWLQSLGAADATWTFNPGPYIPDMPDKLITVTVTDGAGYAAEGALDQPFFQLRTRGNQDDGPGTEAQAFALDAAIAAQRFPQVIDGVSLNLVARTAGAPATLGPPEPDSMRYEYVCTYRVVVGVN